MALQTKTISANGSKGHHKFTLTVTENSTDTAANTSSVSFSFVLSPIQTGWDWAYTNAVNYTVTINGEKYTGSINNYNGSATVTVASDTISVAHNTDGSKTISYSFSVTSLNYSYLTGSASNSGTMDLTKIARKATLTAAPDFNDEENPTISYNNPAGNTVDALEACISFTGATDDIPYRAISKTGTSYTFNLTDAERRTLRTATTGSNSRSVTFFVRTKIGSDTFYHTMAKTFTIINGLPTLNPTMIDSNPDTVALTGDNNSFIKYYSWAYMTVNAEAKKDASIVYQKIEIDGKSTTNTLVNVNNPITLYGVVNPTAIFTVKDSRENTASKTITKNLVEYIKLTCSQDVKIELEGETAAKVELTISGNYFSGSFGAVSNSLTLQVRHTDNSGNMSEWVTLTDGLVPIIGNGTYRLNTTISGLQYDRAYTFQCRAIDALGDVTTEEYVAKLIPVFDWSGSDFNFNVPVSIEGAPIVDYIIEQGTEAMGSNGTWYWSKWKSGKAECYGVRNYGNMSVNTAWGSFYCSGNFTQSLPSGLFAAAPDYIDIHLSQSSHSLLLCRGYGSAPTADTTDVFCVYYPYAATASQVHFAFHAIGRWK